MAEALIQVVDQAIRALLVREGLQGVDVDVAFDVPSEEWAERRNSPTVDIFLFEIREDVKQRSAGRVDIRDDAGRVRARAQPPRWFDLSYVITAWAQRPEDEHRILASVLHVLARHETIPADLLSEGLSDASVHLKVAQPRADGRSLADVWGTLGRRWKAALELVVTAPIDLQADVPAAVVTQRDVHLGAVGAHRNGR